MKKRNDNDDYFHYNQSLHYNNGSTTAAETEKLSQSAETHVHKRELASVRGRLTAGLTTWH